MLTDAWEETAAVRPRPRQRSRRRRGCRRAARRGPAGAGAGAARRGRGRFLPRRSANGDPRSWNSDPRRMPAPAGQPARPDAAHRDEIPTPGRNPPGRNPPKRDKLGRGHSRREKPGGRPLGSRRHENAAAEISGGTEGGEAGAIAQTEPAAPPEPEAQWPAAAKLTAEGATPADSATGDTPEPAGTDQDSAPGRGTRSAIRRLSRCTLPRKPSSPRIVRRRRSRKLPARAGSLMTCRLMTCGARQRRRRKPRRSAIRRRSPCTLPRNRRRAGHPERRAGGNGLPPGISRPRIQRRRIPRRIPPRSVG